MTEKPRYVIERDATKLSNAFAVIDTNVTPQGGDNTPEDRIVGWYDTPSAAQAFIDSIDNPVPVEQPQPTADELRQRTEDFLKAAPSNDNAAEEGITTDPYEKLRRSLKVIREHVRTAAEPEGMEELFDAFVDVAATALMNGQMQATQLERIANAMVAQTKLLCLVYSGTVSEEGIASAIKELKE